jgi:hypothetical protein
LTKNQTIISVDVAKTEKTKKKTPAAGPPCLMQTIHAAAYRWWLSGYSLMTIRYDCSDYHYPRRTLDVHARLVYLVARNMFNWQLAGHALP